MSGHNANSSVHPMTADQERACAPDYGYGSTGLTKRELIAAMAMQGLLAKHGDDDYPEYHKLAEWSVGRADALLAELAKDGDK